VVFNFLAFSDDKVIGIKSNSAASDPQRGQNLGGSSP
jgi:hypothetical protein